MHGAVCPSQLLQAINGTLVGLAIDHNGWSSVGGTVQAQVAAPEAGAGAGAGARAGSTLTTAAMSAQQQEANDQRELFLAPLCAPPGAECVGLGIVRGIDMERGLLYVLTPVAPRVLRSVNVVLRGQVDLPVELLADTASAVAEPYLVSDAITTLGAGGSVMRSRSNIKRRQD